VLFGVGVWRLIIKMCSVFMFGARVWCSVFGVCERCGCSDWFVGVLFCSVFRFGLARRVFVVFGALFGLSNAS
jgi:hypothetical protein